LETPLTATVQPLVLALPLFSSVNKLKISHATGVLTLVLESPIPLTSFNREEQKLKPTNCDQSGGSSSRVSPGESRRSAALAQLLPGRHS
jgi:hypothetical protein